MDIAAKDLKLYDTLEFEGEMYHVINVAPSPKYTEQTYTWLSPTDGLGVDRHLSFPDEFCFNVTNRVN